MVKCTGLRAVFTFTSKVVPFCDATSFRKTSVISYPTLPQEDEAKKAEKRQLSARALPKTLPNTFK